MQIQRVLTASFVALSALHGLPDHALADDHLPEYFEKSACYERTYDSAHLAAHRNQRVTEIIVCTSNHDYSGPGISVQFGFRIRGSDVYFHDEAICRDDRCTVGDNGSTFTIAVRGENILLSIGSPFIVNRANGGRPSPDLSLGGDDLTFLLAPCSEECI